MKKTILLFLAIASHICGVAQHEPTEKLVTLLQELSAGESNVLLKRHFETVMRFARDTTYGFQVSEQDNDEAAKVLAFFQGDGHKWETYLTQPRPLMMSFQSATDGKYSYYWLFLPRDFDASNNSYAFYFELHGSGGGTNNNPRKMLYQPLQPTVGGVAAQGYRKEGLYVYPWGRGDKGYRDIAEKDILEVLQDFDNHFKTNPARQYMYGFSMGAAGTLRIAQATRSRWAAIGAYSGSLNDPGPEDIEKLEGLPVWLAWGELETRLNESNDKLKSMLEKKGNEVKRTVVKGVGHKYLGEYQEELMEWLGKHERK